MIKSSIRILFAVSFGVLVFFAAFEGALRIAYRHSMDFNIEMFKYARDLKTMASNPALGHVHRPNSEAFLMGAQVRINSLGLRNREISLEKKPGRIRILMLGDSLTFGWGVEQEDTTPAVLERVLNARDRDGRYEVVNAGVGNYNTAMEVAYLLEKGRLLKPDLIVLNYFINDTEPTPTRHAPALFRWSYAYNFIAGRIDVALRLIHAKKDWAEYYRELYSDDAEGWRNAQASLERLAAYGKRSGTPVLFVNYPELRQFDPYPFSEATAKIRRAAEKNGFPYFELLDALKGTPPESLWVTKEDPHPNAVASKVFASALEKPILEIIGTAHR